MLIDYPVRQRRVSRKRNQQPHVDPPISRQTGGAYRIACVVLGSSRYVIKLVLIPSGTSNAFFPFDFTCVLFHHSIQLASYGGVQMFFFLLFLLQYGVVL